MIPRLQFSRVLESRMNFLNLIEGFLGQLDIKGFNVLLQEKRAMSSLHSWITEHKSPRVKHATEGKRRDRAADNVVQSVK